MGCYAMLLRYEPGPMQMHVVSHAGHTRHTVSGVFMAYGCFQGLFINKCDI